MKKVSLIPWVFIFFVICYFHILKIDEIPMGLYVDESSIGLNAASISRNLRDEHGYFMPLYFKAFGEYKNPIYIYLAAIMFKLFGISVLNLRLTSFIFFIIALILTLILIYKLFNKNKTLTLYGIIALGFSPGYFNISRISFEVISQLTVTCAWLLCVFLGYKETRYKYQNLYFALSGLLLGVSLYSYTTSKLLSFLFFLLIILCFHKILNWKSWTLRFFAIGFLLGAIPFIVYFSKYPQNVLNPRFNKVMKIEQVTRMPLSSLHQITADYLKSISPEYLAIKGDPDLRDAAPYAGIVFKTTFILGVIGLLHQVKLWKQKKSNLEFSNLLLFGIFIASVGAPLTGEPFYSLRNLLTGIFILLFSCYGLTTLLQLKNNLTKYSLIIITFSFLIIEVINYQYHYFTEYPALSVNAFESNGYVETFIKAKEQHPTKIVISEKTNQPYIHYRFYDQIHNLDENVKVEIGPLKPEIGTCILFIPENKEKLDKLSIDYAYIDYKDVEWYYSARCY